MRHQLECIECHARYPSSYTACACSSCGDLLQVTYDFNDLRESVDVSAWKSRPPSVWKYEQLLPIDGASMKITLGEGGTTLHKTTRLGELLGIKRLNVKNEGENPTGSFKDRGMTVGVSRAVEVKAKKVICASTGNTSASLAAYAAKAGLECIVIIPQGKIALGKLVQAIAHGARVIQLEGYFDDALRAVLTVVKSNPKLYLLNSVNPYRVEGQKTLAYEIWDQLEGDIPDTVIVPVGNAGNISAIWKGFQDLQEIGMISHPPRMIGIQAQGASPVTEAFKTGRSEIIPIQHPQTIATAIKIGSPASWKKALRAVRDSGGIMEAVTDDEILEAQRLLARLEGVFVEPASASSIAGVKKLIEVGLVGADERVTCVVTGHGLKDPEIVSQMFEKPRTVKAGQLEFLLS
ncbi:MAG: threonine synthase [Candidatus Bathyarchaeia archaeon]